MLPLKFQLHNETEWVSHTWTLNTSALENERGNKVMLIMKLDRTVQM